MSTKINWTHETWNPVAGCSKVSSACKFCYAERDWKRLSANPRTVYFGRKFTDVQCHPERLVQPLNWARPRMIFVNSMSDLFHPDVPFEFIDKVFAVMALAQKHTFKILTKRPERMLEYYTLHFSRSKYAREASTFSGRRDSEGGGDLSLSDGQFPLPNLWIGVSVENQQTANERISLLLRMPAAVRWISAEPLLGPIDLSEWIKPMLRCRISGCPENIDCEEWEHGYKLHWVVAGGESGPYASPMHPDWAFSLLEQCNAANIHFFFKQWGEWVSPGLNGFGTHPGRIAWIDSTGAFLNPPPEDEDADCLTVKRVGRKVAGRLLGGILYDAFPIRGK